MRPQTIIFSGHSSLPENVTAEHVFGFLAVEAEIDLADMRITDVSCTLVPSLAEKLLTASLVGRYVEEGIQNAVQEVDARLYSTTKRAIIAALEDLHRRYLEYLKEQEGKR
jgi:hypothetical protein